jgi:hypothetical protein
MPGAVPHSFFSLRSLRLCVKLIWLTRSREGAESKNGLTTITKPPITMLPSLTAITGVGKKSV